MKSFSVSVVALSLLGGCYSNQQNSIDQYLALSPARQGAAKDQRIQNFVNLYNHLEKRSVALDTEKAYAEFLYFNDTLVTLHTRKDLIEYLENTQKKLESLNLEVLNVFETNGDVYVQWVMDTRFTVMGKRSDVKSLGISQLRFDPNGKIILHQDYWDSTNGFFQHIPLLGGILQWIKTRLHS